MILLLLLFFFFKENIMKNLYITNYVFQNLINVLVRILIYFMMIKSNHHFTKMFHLKG